MFSMTIKSNIADEIRRLRVDIAKQPIAIAKALTFTAEDVQKAEREEIRRVFDRPTPFTLNSLFKTSATPVRLQAIVYFRHSHRFRQHFLEPQVEGGGRETKQFEKHLRQARHMRADEYIVPGERAQLDAYGNLNRGQIVQILSALKAIPERGFLANRSKASAARRAKSKRPRALVNYFVGQPHPGTPRGVWERVGKTGLRPILIFVRAPRYQKRFRFYDLAKRTTDARFPAHLVRAIQRERVGAGSLSLAA